MKTFIKKLVRNKFQVLFFVGLLALLVVAIALANSTPTNNQEANEGNNTPVQPIDNSNTDLPVFVESLSIPMNSNSEYKIVRRFYNENDSKEQKINSLMFSGNTYYTSQGVSYSLINEGYFDVLASISGTVIEASTSALQGKYVIVQSDKDIKTYYYGLSELSVKKGDRVVQGKKLGVSGTNTLDQAAGIHVYFQVSKNDKFINPESYIGTKIDEL